MKKSSKKSSATSLLQSKCISSFAIETQGETRPVCNWFQELQNRECCIIWPVFGCNWNMLFQCFLCTKAEKGDLEVTSIDNYQKINLRFCRSFCAIHLKSPSTLNRRFYQFFYFGEIKKCILFNILMMLHKRIIWCNWVRGTISPQNINFWKLFKTVDMIPNRDVFYPSG